MAGPVRPAQIPATTGDEPGPEEGEEAELPRVQEGAAEDVRGDGQAQDKGADIS